MPLLRCTIIRSDCVTTNISASGWLGISVCQLLTIILFFLSSVRRHAVAIVGYSTVVCDRRCVTLILFDHFSYLMAYIQYIKLCMK